MTHIPARRLPHLRCFLLALSRWDAPGECPHACRVAHQHPVAAQHKFPTQVHVPSCQLAIAAGAWQLWNATKVRCVQPGLGHARRLQAAHIGRTRPLDIGWVSSCASRCATFDGLARPALGTAGTAQACVWWARYGGGQWQCLAHMCRMAIRALHPHMHACMTTTHLALRLPR